ncbi:cytochrome P450 [Pseudooceanicola sp. CBS1P-1]|uniref:Cytochrome P450 n=1 Tax=Pseudooceanicola albus TaxID=2692189 RepID=A0A6L7G884_9RHOB|nr:MULTISPECIES: cytochrome P450 [Pseudooceanicola]MBT9386241.1 cytochrome P450 [Pseudooceanicola endophyticus]MXN20291.1 cytochrome P450 [Pseudooceanicola albus]
MPEPTIPVFDASSEVHQNLGLLKVAAMATRQHGDVVTIRASDQRAMTLLGGTAAIRYWKAHQGHFLKEMGDVASNARITRILLGDRLEQPDMLPVWDRVRCALASAGQHWDGWAEAALSGANDRLCTQIAQAEGALDLRPLCGLWALRSLAPAVLGDSLPEAELLQGLADVERFYFSMSTRDAEETAHPEQLEEFRTARGFLDRAIAAGLETMKPGDDSVLATAAAALPEDMDAATRIACLRPGIGRMLLEKLNIEGLGLLWALVHLAQDPALAEALTQENAQSDPDAPDAATPLTLSVVREAQRMYPELPFIYRVTTCAVSLAGHEIPAGTTVLFAPWLTHRDPRYWSTPERFDGRRFLVAPEEKSSFLPFGTGPRVRARDAFLTRQMVLALRRIARDFRLTLAPECKRGSLRPILRSTLAPRGPVPVRFAAAGTASAQFVSVLEDLQ